MYIPLKAWEVLYWYKLSRFRDFFGVREVYTREITLSMPLAKVCTRETFMRLIEISIKNHQKWRQNEKISRKFLAIAKVLKDTIRESL